MEKIRSLSADKVLEVEDFIDFLRQRTADRYQVQAAARLSEDSLSKVCGQSRRRGLCPAS